MMQFPGGIGLTELEVYDWPGPDGVAGGSPHVHMASTECYVVLAGTGRLEMLTVDGVRDADLSPGAVVWFDPGTVHRVVNTSGDLRILVAMSNSGLPEAGDAVMTFPPPHLERVETYAAAASVHGPDGDVDVAKVRARRDLALAGYQRLRQDCVAGDGALVRQFLAQARELVAPRANEWANIVADGPVAQATDAADRVAALADGDVSRLHRAGVYRLAEPARAYGMCGLLRGYRAHQAERVGGASL